MTSRIDQNKVIVLQTPKTVTGKFRGLSDKLECYTTDCGVPVGASLKKAS